ncbi:hypothetical protein FNL56_16600 [Tardiphaga sp. vice304]|nr:hypothetical protein FNL56_16600 [Tardiphaga sp. vice304]
MKLDSMRLRVAFFVAVPLMLAGCGGGHDRYAAPGIDTRNLDQAKYNNDLADCTQLKKDHGFVGDGGMIGDCLTQRGYRVTDPKG